MNKILVPVDFSEGCVLALNEAVTFARAFDVSVVLLHVIHDPTDAPGFYASKKAGKQVFRNMEDSARQMMKEFTSQRLLNFAQYRALTVPGVPAAQIVRAAKKSDVDLVVMGTHGRGGIDRVMLGSVADKVIRGAPCPVLLVREPPVDKPEEPDGEDGPSAEGTRTIDNVLVPVDFSDCSSAALRQATKVAKKFQAQLQVLHVVHDPGDSPGFYASEAAGAKVFRNMEDAAREMMAEFAKARLKKVENYETYVVQGIPATQIMGGAEQNGADLIVMGTHGRGGLDRLLLGSVADKVVRGGPCPVMVVHEKK